MLCQGSFLIDHRISIWTFSTFNCSFPHVCTIVSSEEANRLHNQHSRHSCHSNKVLQPLQLPNPCFPPALLSLLNSEIITSDNLSNHEIIIGLISSMPHPLPSRCFLPCSSQVMETPRTQYCGSVSRSHSSSQLLNWSGSWQDTKMKEITKWYWDAPGVLFSTHYFICKKVSLAGCYGWNCLLHPTNE